MKQHLIDLVRKAQIADSDRFNQEHFIDTRVHNNDGIMIARAVLGNFFAKGYVNEYRLNYEIFKDHSTWQIWVWDFEADKDTSRNDFNAPYHKYDEVIQFIESTF